MTDIGGYIHHVTRSPGMKVYYGACAADRDQFSTGNSFGYRQYGGTCSYDERPSCKYPVVYSKMAGPEVVSRDAGRCGDVTRMPADFRSDGSQLVQGQTLSASTVVEIYPWMKETRLNQRHQRRPPTSSVNTGRLS